MKKFFQYSLMAVVSMLALNACTDSDSYTAAGPEGNTVFFPLSLSQEVELDREGTSFDVKVQRVKSDYDVTVPLTLNGDTLLNRLHIPATISMASGQSEATFKVTYDPAEWEYDEAYDFSISIGDENLQTPYGRSVYSFSALKPAPLTYLGVGTLIDNFWYENGDDPWPVEIYQNQLNPYEFRIMNPFGMAENYDACDGTQSKYMTINVMRPGNTLADQDITVNDLVYFSSCSTGYKHSTYNATVWVHHPVAFAKYATQDSWMHNRVVDYQENGLPGRIQLAPFYYMDGVGGWDNTQADEVIIIDFPDYEPKDLALEVEYAGVLTGVDEQFYAQTYVTLGEDVKNAKALVVEGDADPQAVADAIAAGDVETAVDVANGINNIPIPEDMTGELMLVITVIDGDKAKVVETVNFEFYGGGANPWTSLGIGRLYDNMVVSMYTDPASADENPFEPQIYEVEILENSEKPGLYRVVNAFQGAAQYINTAYGAAVIGYTPANLEVNATDPDGTYVLPQSTGVDDGDGLISICTMGGYFMSRGESFDQLKDYGYMGMLRNGVIVFPNIPNKDEETGETSFTYQGLFIQGSSSYYAGTDGAFAIVLPSAVKSAQRYIDGLAKAKKAYQKTNGKRIKVSAHDKVMFTKSTESLLK